MTQGGTTGPELPGMTCLGLLGSGGFADVYLYERHHPRIRVAVKLMKATALDEEQRRQFAAEAEVMAELADHPYIVPVLGAGTTADGRPYLMMRHYPNADLAARVRRSPMSVPDALRFGIQLASAVETAHRVGIVHRDIKPSNILLTSYGVPGLSDFGTAGRPAEAGDEEVGVSLPWSPPEVLSGASNGSVASDVYSLAATIWNLLVGRSPFAEPGGDNSDRGVFTRIMHLRPPPTGRDDVPASLDRLLQQAMAKDPSQRPTSALELARYLQRIEQELMLARTEIVVLDPHSHPLPSAPSLAASPTKDPEGGLTRPGPGGQDEIATQRKTPTRITAQRQASATRPPGGYGRADQPLRTRVRPSRVSAQPATERTTEPDDRTHGERRGTPWLLGGLAVLAVAAVGVGALLLGGGEEPEPDEPLPKPPVETDLPGVERLVSAPAEVTARRNGDRAVFTWDPVAYATGYRWVATDASGAEVDHGRIRQPRVGVRFGEATRVCVSVRTLGEGGAVSQGAARACVG